MADEIFEREVAGRMVQFRPPTQGQLLVVGRLLRTGRQFTDAEPDENGKVDKDKVKLGVEKMSMILDVIDSMIVNPADQAFLENEIVTGKLDLEELMAAFESDEAPANRATKRANARKPSARARNR